MNTFFSAPKKVIETQREFREFASQRETILEEKIDGWFCTLYKVGRVITLFSKTGRDITSSMPKQALLQAYKLPSGIYVGEYIYGTNWARTQAALPYGSLVLFDMMKSENSDLRNLRLLERKQFLIDAFQGFEESHLKLNVTYLPKWERYEEIIAREGEGVVLKQNVPYIAGKNNYMAKLKRFEFCDLVCISAIKSGSDTRAGYWQSFIFSLGNGRTVSVGSMTQSLWTMENPVGKVFRVKHFGLMKSGSLRHPSIDSLHEEKSF